MKVEVIPIFSTPVVKTNIGRNFTKKELQLFLTDIPMYKDVERGMTNYGSKDTYLFDSHTDTLKDIKKFCEYPLKNYLEEIEGVDTDLAGLRITQSWLNKTKPSEHHPSHYHTNSYLAGVLYISCLQNDSINFENRIQGMFNYIEFPKKKITDWTTETASIDVKEGDLILFPAWMIHGVSPNNTKNRERISLAFNTFPIGEMGTYERGTHLKL